MRFSHEFSLTNQHRLGLGLLIFEVSRSHTIRHKCVCTLWLLWTGDQLVTMTTDYTKLSRDRHPWLRRYSNQQSRQASDRGATP